MRSGPFLASRPATAGRRWAEWGFGLAVAALLALFVHHRFREVEVGPKVPPPEMRAERMLRTLGEAEAAFAALPADARGGEAVVVADLDRLRGLGEDVIARGFPRELWERMDELREARAEGNGVYRNRSIRFRLAIPAAGAGRSGWHAFAWPAERGAGDDSMWCYLAIPGGELHKAEERENRISLQDGPSDAAAELRLEGISRDGGIPGADGLRWKPVR